MTAQPFLKRPKKLTNCNKLIRFSASHAATPVLAWALADVSSPVFKLSMADA